MRCVPFLKGVDYITVQYQPGTTSQNEAYALAYDLSKSPGGAQGMIVGLMSAGPWAYETFISLAEYSRINEFRGTFISLVKRWSRVLGRPVTLYVYDPKDQSGRTYTSFKSD